jgi:hypothetical protein
METPFKDIIFEDKFTKLKLQKCSESLFTYMGEMPSQRQASGTLTSNDRNITRPY